MSNGRRDFKEWGILRCMICGEEKDRVPKGLNYGFPKCCNKTMRVVTPKELAEEQEYFMSVEEEEAYLESVERSK